MCALPPPANSVQILKEVHVTNNKTVLVTMNSNFFDTLCLCLGNTYKADSWLAMRVHEVGDLSDDTIRSYLRTMFKEALSRHKHSHGTTAEEARISSVISHIIQ